MITKNAPIVTAMTMSCSFTAPSVHSRTVTRPRAALLAAAAICFGLELFQLTGIPKTLPRLLRAAIGDTFAWHDVACYAVGALVTTVVTRMLSLTR